MVKKTYKVVDDLNKLASQLAQILLSAYCDCKDLVFTVALSGGSVVKVFCQALPFLEDKVDWSKWRFFFCDERIVDFEDEDSNFGLYWKTLEPLKQKLPLSREQFVTINPTLQGQECAENYQSKLERCFGIGRTHPPRFHFVLLGMGPDGHIASLFPGHPLLEAKTKWVEFIGDSPKPPINRVTLTLPVINMAAVVTFVVTGSSKAAILKNIMVDGQDLPAGRVNPSVGHLIWLLDNDAVALLPPEIIPRFD